MMFSRLGLLLFLSATVPPPSSLFFVHAQLWSDTSCASLGMTANNVQLECLNLCAPMQSTSFAGLEANTPDENSTSRVLRCQCNADESMGCLDSQVILNPTKPLPTCDSLSITSIEHCNPICRDLGKVMDVFRDVNDITECGCVGADICNDDPTCAQILVFPGSAAEDCEEYCTGRNGDAVATDDVEFAGGEFVANKDQTHLRVSCRCGGVEECRDSILFSDLAFLDGCTADLDITSDASCQNHCTSVGFTADAVYMTEGQSSNCTCASDEGVAVACRDDAPESDDGPSVEETSPDDDDTSAATKNGSSMLLGTFVGSIISVFVMLF